MATALPPAPAPLGPEELRSIQPDRVLDSLGEVCPYPVRQALDALAGLAPGAVLVQLTDHSTATQTVPAAVWRAGLAHLLGITEDRGRYRIYLKRI